MSQQQTDASLLDKLKGFYQYPLPHHLLSRLMHRFTRLRIGFIYRPFTRWFIKQFKVNLGEALHTDLNHYRSFNEFFTRELKPDARSIVSEKNELACPVDGMVSQAGEIKGDTLFQAKGHEYSLQELLGGSAELASQFTDGEFATIYLSPKDYHRIHMPIDGKLTEMVHVPGRLFSVSPATARSVPRLFARNERVVCLFDTEIGPVAMILVGAIFVASIETVWSGEVTPPTRGTVKHWKYTAPEHNVFLKKGEEMGRFNMGSTVIMLYGKDAMEWADTVKAEAPTRMGELLGEVVNKS